MKIRSERRKIWERLTWDADQCSRGQCVQRFQQTGDQRVKRVHSIAGGDQHHYGDREFSEVLLKLKVLIGSQENIESFGCSSQQFAILQCRPSRFSDGQDVVSGQFVLEFLGQRLVKQDAHRGSAPLAPVRARLLLAPATRKEMIVKSLRGNHRPQDSQRDFSAGPAFRRKQEHHLEFRYLDE